MDQKEKRLIIVDISSFIFRAYYAIRPLHSPEGVPVNAIHGVLSMMMKLFSNYRPTHVLLARDTSGGSFRNELYSEYKANRTEPPEDLVPQFPLIVELIEKMNLPNVLHENYEADDLIGSAAVQWKDEFDEILIASGDKDLMQFVDGPVKMVDTMKDKTYDREGVFEKMGVYPEQIVDYLSMVGDTSDNIPGMKGIGAKGAAKLLAEHETLDKCIELKDTFKGKKLINAFENHLDDAILSKKLIQIVTDIPLDLKSDETKFTFYPSLELIEYLRSLGFKTALKKLQDIRDQVDRNGGESLDAPIVEKLEDLYKVTKVDSTEDVEKLLEKVSNEKRISLSTFFDSDVLFERNISGISLACDENEVFYITADCDKVLTNIYQRKDLLIVSEDIKEDYKYSLGKGFFPRAQLFDLSQGHFVIDPGLKHDIKNIAKEYLDQEIPAVDKKKIKENDEEYFLSFHSSRAFVLFKLYPTIIKKLETLELTDIYFGIDNSLCPVLAKMETTGISLNVGYLEDFGVELKKEITVLEDKVEDISGEKINLNSPKQVGELLFEKLELPIIKKTKTGASTDSEVLVELDSRDLSEIPGIILKYRELSKILSTYVSALPEILNQKTGKIHTHFNQNIAATGRLSSTNPNLQNIPVRSENGKRVRKAFMATPGKLLLTADYSQVELRLLAHFSKDETMVNAFKNDQDIHAQTASEVLGIPLSEVNSDQRAAAKAVNFGLMYGQSSFGLAKALRIGRKEAKEYITNYFERFHSVKSYLDSLKETCEKTGIAQTLHGRKRPIPDIHSTNRTIKANAERVAINSPIQGTAADIIKIAMINIDKKMEEKELSSKMLLQVHDELIFEVPEDELDTMKDLVREEMENVVSLEIPLKVDMGIGVNWFDLK